jgi:hypothetical protein
MCAKQEFVTRIIILRIAFISCHQRYVPKPDRILNSYVQKNIVCDGRDGTEYDHGNNISVYS